MKRKSLILLPFVIATSSFAATTYTPPSINVSPILATLGAVATALAGIWVVKKVIKLLNKS